jgi:phospholipid N-methyltransferase
MKSNLQKGLISLPLVIGLAGGFFLKNGIDTVWGDGVGTFVKGVFNNPKEVGAFTPCSRYVAREVAKHVNPKIRNRLRVLEIGAGTGVLTEKIIENLIGHDFVFDIIEINPDFCKKLYKRFGGYKGVSINAVDILQWHPEEEYDVIVSALPFNNFSEQFVKDVLYKYEEMIASGGHISYVELAMPKRMRSMFAGDHNGEYARKKKFIADFKDAHFDEEILVLKNVPPLYVYHLKVNK